ncbi:246_t:CDS:1, partial [Funneliformis caledonium]
EVPQSVNFANTVIIKSFSLVSFPNEKGSLLAILETSINSLDYMRHYHRNDVN